MFLSREYLYIFLFLYKKNMLWYSLEAPRRGASYECHIIFFVENYDKYYADTFSCQELCRITKRNHLGMAKAGLMIAEWSYFRVVSMVDFYCII